LPKFPIDFLEDYSSDQMLAELSRIASMTGKTTVTTQDLAKNGRVSHSAIVRRFGSLRVALEKVGLTSARFMTDALPNLQTLCLACNRGKRDSLE
jgi:HNH endonuclease